MKRMLSSQPTAVWVVAFAATGISTGEGTSPPSHARQRPHGGLLQGGNRAEQLTRIAREARADVIAVGRSTKLRHQLAGSLGQGLARKRKAPIVVIVP